MKKYDLNSKIFPKVTKPERAGIYRDKNDENVSKNVTWSLKSHETVKTRPLSVKIDSTVEKSTSETKNDPWKTTTFSKTRKSSKKEGVWLDKNLTFSLFLILVRTFLSKTFHFSLFALKIDRNVTFHCQNSLFTVKMSLSIVFCHFASYFQTTHFWDALIRYTHRVLQLLQTR